MPGELPSKADFQGAVAHMEKGGDEKSVIFAIWDVKNTGFSADSTSKNRAFKTKEKSTARRRKIVRNCSGPENRDVSISLCKHIANAKDFSIVFEHLDRSRRRKIIFAI